MANFKHLIFYTSGYPFGNGETFIENEISYLAKEFSKITIIPTGNLNINLRRELPDNCQVHLLPTRVTSVFNICKVIFTKEFCQELINIKKNKQLKINLLTIKTMLASILDAKHIYQQSFHLICEHSVGYAYWCDNSAISLTYWPNKTIARCHGWDTYFYVHPNKYLPFRSQLLEKIGIIAPISLTGAKYIEKNWTNRKYKNVITSFLGVNKQKRLSNFTPYTLYSCSNIIPLKRLPLIIEALKKLEQPITWYHIGGGIDFNKISLLAQQEELSQHKIYFLGTLTNEEVHQFIRENSPKLFINVSSSEGIPVSIMESMSYGIPCVATQVGGTPEIVNNSNGFLLDSLPQPEDIAKQIDRFLQMDDAAFQKYSDSAFETWNEKFDAEKNYTNFVRLLKTSSN